MYQTRADSVAMTRRFECFDVQQACCIQLITISLVHPHHQKTARGMLIASQSGDGDSDGKLSLIVLPQSVLHAFIMFAISHLPSSNLASRPTNADGL
mgnify:CR=1 FL=1